MVLIESALNSRVLTSRLRLQEGNALGFFNNRKNAASSLDLWMAWSPAKAVITRVWRTINIHVSTKSMYYWYTLHHTDCMCVEVGEFGPSKYTPQAFRRNVERNELLLRSILTSIMNGLETTGFFCRLFFAENCG